MRERSLNVRKGDRTRDPGPVAFLADRVSLEVTNYMARRSADSGANGKVSYARRSDRFLAGLEQASSVTFVSHVHPDPDSLGSMLGLAHLVETCLKKPTRLTRDGLINRAENRLWWMCLASTWRPSRTLSGRMARPWSW